MAENQKENTEGSTETLSTEEFSNENLSLTVEKKPHCLIEYHVKVGPDLAIKSYKNAVKKISKEVTIPGFRKGKAPEEIIRKKYKDTLDQKWQKELADMTFKECQSLTKIPLLGPDAPVSFKMHEHSQGGANMDFSFETEPEVPEIDYKSISLEKPEKQEVTDQKVDDTIRQIRLFYADWQKILDRPVQDGDFVLLDVTVTEEDPPRAIFNNTRFEVNPEKMAKWMYDLVLGQTVGQALEGVSQPDEKASEEEKEKLQPKKVLVVIKAIEHAKLPELNDEFAARVGASGVEEMKKKLRELLEKQAEEDVRQKQREELSRKLIDICDFDLPQSLINKETSYRLRSLMQNQSFLQDWRNKTEEERKREQEKIQKEAENAVRLFYISKKVVSDANIKITQEELRPQVSTPLEAMFVDPSLFQFEQKSEEEQALTLSRVMLAKAEDYLISQLEK
ncbi:MAG: trigger factor [Simkaniaceae bacterium]